MSYELKEIVMKITGPVRATGDSGEDERRMANLCAMANLVDDLAGEMYSAGLNADRHEASMRAIGNYAKDRLRTTVNETLEGL